MLLLTPTGYARWPAARTSRSHNQQPEHNQAVKPLHYCRKTAQPRNRVLSSRTGVQQQLYYRCWQGSGRLHGFMLLREALQAHHAQLTCHPH
jgi:hypothetical protein